MPVVPSQMRRVLQSASLCAIFLMLLAQNAIELAITPINAPSALEKSAAKARITRDYQRTLRRAQSAAQSATSLTLSAQCADKLAIMPINALASLGASAAKAQTRRNSQRTLRRAQSAAQSATSLTSSAQDVAKLAITQTGALSHIRTTAAKAQLPRNPQEHHLSMLLVTPLSAFPSSHSQLPQLR